MSGVNDARMPACMNRPILSHKDWRRKTNILLSHTHCPCCQHGCRFGFPGRTGNAHGRLLGCTALKVALACCVLHLHRMLVLEVAKTHFLVAVGMHHVAGLLVQAVSSEIAPSRPLHHHLHPEVVNEVSAVSSVPRRRCQPVEGEVPRCWRQYRPSLL